MAPEIDSSVLIGYPAAKRYLDYSATGADGNLTIGPPTTVYLRTGTGAVDAVPRRRSTTGWRHRRREHHDHSVLERRSEIGLRRALGATRPQIRAHSLSEAILLAIAGGAAGIAIGAIAGLLPAIRAARLSPTEALRTA
ncbi:MAG TPA: ABC transporter permease [Solirubrobacteraceae bacterium]|nr:ABC transporter permease [Solirubrobacteraceae bacterium]